MYCIRLVDRNAIIMEEEESDSPASDSSLEQIDQDLEGVENVLRTSRRRLGRAFYASVDSMLGSVRSRLEGRQINASSDELSERLRNAELAHSAGIPLNLLRSNRDLQERRGSRSSILERVSSVSNIQKRTNEDQNAGAAEPPTSQQQESLRGFHRSSSLVASRVQAEELDPRLDVFGGGADMPALTPVAETVEATGASDDMETEDAKDTDDDMEIDVDTAEETAKEPETPILLSELSQKMAAKLTRSISGSIAPSSDNDEVSGYAVYSWGPQTSSSLHDDGEAKTVADAQLSSRSRIGRLSGILSVAAGPRHSACATKEGQVFTCGDNSFGAVDPSRRDVTSIVRPSVLEVLGTAVVRQVSCGWDHTAAVTTTGAVLTWGCNDKDQLGHLRSSSDSPTTFCGPKTLVLGPGRRAISVACGNKFTIVLTTRMSVLVCGDDAVSGYKATSPTEEKASRRLPGQLPALVGLPLVSVAAGKGHAVVLTAHGSAYAWGNNAFGSCGRPHPKQLSLPVPIIMPRNHSETPLGATPFPNWVQGSGLSMADDVAVVHAACGDDHTVLVTRSGRLLVCGSNSDGQLGTENGKLVEQVEALNHPDKGRHFRSAEAGNKNTLLVDDVGDVWQMGAGSGLRRVLAGKNILTIAAGGKQCVAVAVGGAKHLQFSMTEDERLAASSSGNLAQSLESLVKRVPEEKGDDRPLSSEGEDLVKRTGELLKYPSVLNSLFLDPNELDHLYTEICKVGGEKLRSALSVATEQSIKLGLDSIRTENARLIHPEAVRFLLHYIRFFDREDDESVFDVRGSCIQSLCEALLNLPYEGFKALMGWISLYPRELFVPMLLNPLLRQLSIALHIDVDANGVEHVKASRKTIPAIVGVLRWLNRASERTGNAKPEDFYSAAVGKIPLELLYEDLRALKNSNPKQRSSSFLICANPFLIPPSTKRDLLQIESNVNMIKVATQDAQFDASAGHMEVDPFFVLEIERDNLLQKTLENIKKARPIDLRKKLRVKFKGEEGVDAGGVTKEFFQLLSEELFDVSSGLWTRRFGDEITWFNPDCTWDDEGFEMVGVLVGLALYNGVLIDVHFPSAVYRKLLNLPLGLEDLVDQDLRKGLQQLLDYEGDDVEMVFCLTFEVSWIDLDVERKVELKPGGGDIPVTSRNKEEYVLLYVKWLLVDSIEPQWNAFKKGLMRLMQTSSLDLFGPQELELFVVGSPDFNFSALEENTQYEGGYDKESPVVKNLWRFVKSADIETQKMFLKFSTGTSMVSRCGGGC